MTISWCSVPFSVNSPGKYSPRSHLGIKKLRLGFSHSFMFKCYFSRYGTTQKMKKSLMENFIFCAVWFSGKISYPKEKWTKIIRYIICFFLKTSAWDSVFYCRISHYIIKLWAWNCINALLTSCKYDNGNLSQSRDYCVSYRPENSIFSLRCNFL